LRVSSEGAPQYWAERALALLRPAFDPQKPTALFVGRYQPSALVRSASPCATPMASTTQNHCHSLPLSSASRLALSAYSGRFVIVPLPKITHVCYGRDVGYIVERIVLDDKIEAISATQLRLLGAEL
jgi:hypothetical protein